MLKRIFHSVLAVWLAVLVLFGGTAKELVHSFANHQDTEHTADFGKGKAVAEKAHHHCEFLHFTLTPFHYQELRFEVQFHEKPEALTYHLAPDALVVREVSFRTLRGPPSVG